MKRFLCLVLTLTMLCSVILPVFAAVETEREYMPLVVDPSGAVEVDTNRLLQAASTKRAVTEDNLVFPGPLVTKCSFLPTGDSDLPLGVYCTGKTRQYMCMLVYSGSEPTGEPVASDYALFDMSKGFGTYELTWKKNNIPTGRYTLVTFTAEKEGGVLYAVEDTIFMTDMYVYETSRQWQHSFITYPDVWEELDVIRLPLGETTVLAAGRSPLPSHGIDKVSLSGPRVRIEEAGGYFFMTPSVCSFGTALFRYGSGNAYIPVEVCYQDSGHQVIESFPAGVATSHAKGCTLYVCGICGQVGGKATPSFYDNFYNFKDVPKNSWYYSSVKKAVTRNLFNGVNTTTFGPDRPMTRAMLVTVLWRYEGQPSAPAGNFTDVREKDWFAQAVNWAAGEGIVNGVGKGKFNPDGTITREQLATILYRYAEKKALDITLSAEPSAYPDWEELSTWATQGMSWALGTGLISGVGKNGETYLVPKGDATRAQVATILVRYIENLVELTVYPDLSTALDGGANVGFYAGNDITWAFYESGLLQIGGNGSLLYNSPEDIPWNSYRDRITKIEILTGAGEVWGVFKEYPVLETVIMADTVTTVESEAFYKCPKLSYVRFSSSLRTIGKSAFRQCKSLKEIYIPDGCAVDIQPYAFADNVALETVYLGDNVRSVGEYSFKKCKVLKEIDLPDSILTMLGSHSFYGCYALERVRLPLGMRSIDSLAFYDCTSLKEIEMPYGLTTVEQGIFLNCTSLESIVFPPSLLYMDTGAFIGCTSLKELYFLTDTLYLTKGEFREDTDDDFLPFGDVEKVVVYGIPDSKVQEHANQYGYEFRDIMNILS